MGTESTEYPQGCQNAFVNELNASVYLASSPRQAWSCSPGLGSRFSRRTLRNGAMRNNANFSHLVYDDQGCLWSPFWSLTCSTLFIFTLEGITGKTKKKNRIIYGV